MKNGNISLSTNKLLKTRPEVSENDPQKNKNLEKQDQRSQKLTPRETKKYQKSALFVRCPKSIQKIYKPGNLQTRNSELFGTNVLTSQECLKNTKRDVIKNLIYPYICLISVMK